MANARDQLDRTEVIFGLRAIFGILTKKHACIAHTMQNTAVSHLMSLNGLLPCLHMHSACAKHIMRIKHKMCLSRPIDQIDDDQIDQVEMILTSAKIDKTSRFTGQEKSRDFRRFSVTIKSSQRNRVLPKVKIGLFSYGKYHQFSTLPKILKGGRWPIIDQNHHD